MTISSAILVTAEAFCQPKSGDRSLSAVYIPMVERDSGALIVRDQVHMNKRARQKEGTIPKK